jgi:hypothetical protein
MNIQLFNFLEDQSPQIVQLLTTKARRSLESYGALSAETVQLFVEQMLDGYIDVLVTGQTDAVDKVFNAITRVVAVSGFRFSDAIQLPLLLTQIIRRLLAEEHADEKDEATLRKFNQAIEQTETTGHRLVCRFLDLFQERLEKRVEDYNQFISQMQREFGVNLTALDPEPEKRSGN